MISFMSHTGWLMAIAAFSVAFIYFFRSVIGPVKVWPRRWVGANWMLMGMVYLLDSIFQTSAADVRIWFRLASLLLVVAYLAYYADIITLIYRRVRGPTVDD